MIRAFVFLFLFAIFANALRPPRSKALESSIGQLSTQTAENPLPKITALFWDVGGVLLSNAWDRAQRKQALDHFALNEAEFDDRHDMVISSFERGKIGLQEYLERTVFYRPRSFTIDDFKNFFFSLSQPNPPALELARSLAGSGQYLMATINNESTDLNLYRIHTFGLQKIFSLFVSSCFVGFRKP